MQFKIGVVGLGYVGLPLAVTLADKFALTVGFDINPHKIQSLQQGIDQTGEVDRDKLKSSSLIISNNTQDLKQCNFFIVAVPTPVDGNKRPDLTPLIEVSKMLGKIISQGAIIVYESTVYPGVTREICGSILAQTSGLTQGVDFKLGYSPERINPGDKEHTITKIIKVVSAEDEETLDKVAEVYGAIITAGIYRADSLEVAEMAKVIENTQRDINIALMNEIALICDRLNLRTKDVLDTAKTKWNFLPFTPGLVGGHCIGVDPYYLTTKAEELGYRPEVILSGRRINDNMGSYIGQKAVKLMIKNGLSLTGAKVGILCLTFKENVPDLRNSRIPDIIAELSQFGISPIIHDPLVNPQETNKEYKIMLSSWFDFRDLDCLILAVPHSYYLEQSGAVFEQMLKVNGIIIDIKSVLDPQLISTNFTYWSL